MEEFWQLKSEYVPYIGWSKKPYRGATVNIDEHGDRIHQPPKELPVTAPSVRFFGGSTMWGVGANDEGTIPAIFNALSPQFRVHNHGEAGFNSRQSLARLVNLINQQAQLDWVIFYDGHNDIANLCRKEVGLNDHVRRQQINQGLQQYRLRSNKKYILKEAAKIVSYGYIAALIKQLKQSEALQEDHKLYKCCYDEQALEHTADQLIANWQLARRIVEDHGGRFLACLQPSAYINHQSLFPTFEGSDRKPSCMLDKHEMIYRIIRKKLEGESWFYDLSHLLNDHKEYYMDMVHVSAPANKIIAQKIAALVAATQNMIADEQ